MHKNSKMKSSKGSKREKVSGAGGSRQHPMQEIIADDVSSIRQTGGGGEQYPGEGQPGQDGVEEGRSKRASGRNPSGAGSAMNRGQGQASGNAALGDRNALLRADESNIYAERSQGGKKGKKSGREASVDSMDLEMIGKSEEFGQPGREDIYQREMHGRTAGAPSPSKQGS